MPLTQEGPGWAGCLRGTELRGLPLFRGRAKSLGPLGQPPAYSSPSTGFRAARGCLLPGKPT